MAKCRSVCAETDQKKHNRKRLLHFGVSKEADYSTVGARKKTRHSRREYKKGFKTKSQTRKKETVEAGESKGRKKREEREEGWDGGEESPGRGRR